MSPSAPRESRPGRSLGVIVVNFGEPRRPDLEEVRSYLERIFGQNADLEPDRSEAVEARVRRLAAARAPGLLKEYERIGGSPLNDQADRQSAALERELILRGWDARTYSAFQFTPPSIHEKVSEARRDGVERLLVIPVYPICGQSTTVAAVRRVQEALGSLAWSPRFAAVTGWHYRPGYIDLRAASVRAYLAERGLDLTAPDTLLYFSVHGTPVKYLDEGNRYDRYVEEHTRDVARRLGAGDRYAVGFQNHTNRKLSWTQPDNEDRIRDLTERRLVIVPISFMHEQSETLAELDHELREFVEGSGKEYHRVPVPYDSDAFIGELADLAADLLADDPAAGGVLAECRCCPGHGIWCTNGARDLPSSPYIRA